MSKGNNSCRLRTNLNQKLSTLITIKKPKHNAIFDHVQELEKILLSFLEDNISQTQVQELEDKVRSIN